MIDVKIILSVRTIQKYVSGEFFSMTYFVEFLDTHKHIIFNNDILFCTYSGVRQEQDIYVRLIDSVTKQVIRFYM